MKARAGSVHGLAVGILAHFGGTLDHGHFGAKLVESVTNDLLLFVLVEGEVDEFLLELGHLVLGDRLELLGLPVVDISFLLSDFQLFVGALIELLVFLLLDSHLPQLAE